MKTIIYSKHFTYKNGRDIELPDIILSELCDEEVYPLSKTAAFVFNRELSVRSREFIYRVIEFSKTFEIDAEISFEQVGVFADFYIDNDFYSDEEFFKQFSELIAMSHSFRADCIEWE